MQHNDYNDMAGRVMAHAFNDELEKVALSKVDVMKRAYAKASIRHKHLVKRRRAGEKGLDGAIERLSQQRARFWNAIGNIEEGERAGGYFGGSLAGVRYGPRASAATTTEATKGLGLPRSGWLAEKKK